MIYADYEYYCDVYRGTVDADSFCRLATRASSFLDYYTQNRAKDFAELDAVKMCCSSSADTSFFCLESIFHRLVCHSNPFFKVFSL